MTYSSLTLTSSTEPKDPPAVNYIIDAVLWKIRLFNFCLPISLPIGLKKISELNKNELKDSFSKLGLILLISVCLSLFITRITIPPHLINISNIILMCLIAMAALGIITSFFWGSIHLFFYLRHSHWLNNLNKFDPKNEDMVGHAFLGEAHRILQNKQNPEEDYGDFPLPKQESTTSTIRGFENYQSISQNENTIAAVAEVYDQLKNTM